MRPVSLSALARGIVVMVMGASALAWQPYGVRAIDLDRQGQLDTQFSRPDAEITARRLYRALLNREADPRGLDETAADLQRGRLREAVRRIIESQEFRQKTAALPIMQALEQMHLGLLNRPADAYSVTNNVAAMEARQYFEVTLRLMDTAEFRQQVADERRSPAVRRPADPPPPTPPPPVAARPRESANSSVALACQEQVVERIRVQTPGILLLRFEPAEVAGAVTNGAAFDVLDRNRRLTYSCDRAVTYRYDDRRTARRAPAEADFRDTAVLRCHDALREKILRERGGGGVRFASAGIMPMASGESIRGAAIETRRRGLGGTTIHYECEVSGDAIRTTRYRVQ